MTKLYLDTETKGPRPGALATSGLYNYARQCTLLLVSYAIDDGPETVVDIAHGEHLPPDFLDAARTPAVEVVAHNAMFDRVVLHRHPELSRFGIEIAIKHWHCTAARARVHGLPGELEMLSKIYRLGVDGKQDGKALIQLFCEKGADPDAHPGEWLKFMDYSRGDITALRRLYALLPSWCWTEQQRRMYVLDQKINDRGFAVDLELARRMIEVSDKCKASLDLRVQLLTSGAIDKGTQREAVKDWLNDSEELLPDMRAETLRKALRDHKAGRVTLSDAQIEMINLRLLTAKSSTAKCQTAINLAGPDKRVRGAITFNGGGRIGRFSHRGFQPGNMPRPEYDKAIVADAIEALLA